ncbi:MAG: hypothetical protein E7370_06055 [Clostridiales bacterium]|nr:hypothetical protein [Clostridiales bacterium]
MPYVRKIVAFILSVVFLAALIICAGVVFSLKNINITYQNYSSKYLREYEEVKENLSVLKGVNIFSVDKEDVTEAIVLANSQEYMQIVSVERVYPCTVNIVLQERVERFAVLSDGAYKIYDTEGNFVRESAQNDNNIDASPNLIIEGVEASEEINFVANAVNSFENSFGKARALLSSVVYPEDINAEFAELVFNFRSGIKISIVRPNSCLNEKIEEAFSVFNTLNDGQKMQGKLRSFELVGTANGIRAVYEG